MAAEGGPPAGFTGHGSPSASAVSPDEQRVLDLIDPAELVSLTQELIAAPGENPPGGEAETARVLATAAESRGLTAEMTPVTPERPNVLIRPARGGSGPGLLLLGHTDVVPIGAGWTVSPTGGEVRDGRIHGRGATDMKGGLAACLLAMHALDRAGVTLSGPVELAAVVDEEENGLGVRHLLAERAGQRGSAVAGMTSYLGCIVAEPTDLQTIIAARGASYVHVTVTGRAAHAGNPADGVNAIYGAARIVGELERWHDDLATDAHPLAGPATWNVGTIAGGTGGSIVPAECRIVADRRLLPSESPTEVLAEIRSRVAGLGLTNRGLQVAVDMPMDMPGFETAADHGLVTAANGALDAVGGPGRPLGGWTAACDGGFFARDEQVPVVVLGPGSVQTQAHRADESVGIEELVTAARCYALAALRLLR